MGPENLHLYKSQRVLRLLVHEPHFEKRCPKHTHLNRVSPFHFGASLGLTLVTQDRDGWISCPEMVSCAPLSLLLSDQL